MPKTIFRQIDQLFALGRRFGEKKKKLRKSGELESALTSCTTHDTYRKACMRFARDLAERRGSSKFQLCSIRKEEVHNFLERMKLARRPETVHQYASALRKLEELACAHFGRISWHIEEFERPRRRRTDVTPQRGPAYTPEEADQLISIIRQRDPILADALTFIRATGCRAESIFGTRRHRGRDTYRDFSKAVSVEDIDLTRGSVRLEEKGGRIRVVRYDRRYQALMEELVTSAGRGKLFAGLDQQAAYRQIRKAAAEAGITDRGLHGLRKTFAVQRYSEYHARIQDLIRARDWRTLCWEFPVGEQKAKRICRSPWPQTVEKLVRLKLSYDLGHNRIEVTYRYVPRPKVKQQNQNPTKTKEE